ncbi:MAG: hypothetical protein KatS3mg031_1127 [Chitinophagales bacterium]|nr:MAG: hypothetical protein KatS3mg031_1127 [Chitinophagales bacterium]
MKSRHTPFFSVIIPSYNRASLLPVPLKSVLKQTYHSWELIIVDDGSTDNTRQVVESFNDSRIRYFYQTNQERSAARNYGIRQARGQYICFLDSDDYYLPGHLEAFYNKIESCGFPVAVFYCDTYEDRDGELIPFITPEIKAANNVEWVVQAVIGIPRACVHRNIFERYRFNPSIKVGEDVELWARVFREYPVIYIQARTVVFVSHSGRTVAVANEESFWLHLQVMKKIIAEDVPQMISPAVRKRVVSNAWFRLGQHYVYTGRRLKAIRALLTAWWLAPSYRAREKWFLIFNQFWLTRSGLRLMRMVKSPQART